MKKISIAVAFMCVCGACGVQDTEQTTTSVDTTSMSSDAKQAPQDQPAPELVLDTPVNKGTKVYSNKRFRDVKIQKLANDSFLITGQGQIFEASFNWIVEDGHEQLQHGYSTTDAGAPEWGNFSFKIHAPKIQPNSTLHLVLFETSAQDGSRQYELPLLLH